MVFNYLLESRNKNKEDWTIMVEGEDFHFLVVTQVAELWSHFYKFGPSRKKFHEDVPNNGFYKITRFSFSLLLAILNKIEKFKSHASDGKLCCPRQIMYCIIYIC